MCQDQYQRNFHRFVYEYFIRTYLNILYVENSTSRAFILFITVLPSTIPTFPSPPPTPISFFSWNSQRRNIVNVISHLTILVGQAKRSHCFFPNLHNKNDWTRIFLDLWVEGGCFGWLNRIKRMKTQKAHLYTPFTFHAKFHTPLLRVKKAGNSQRTITEWESGVKHNLNNK